MNEAHSTQELETDPHLRATILVRVSQAINILVLKNGNGRGETESRSPRHPHVSRGRNDRDHLYIHLRPKGVSLVHFSQRVKVGKMENPDLAKTCGCWRKPFHLGFHFTSMSHRGGGDAGSAVKGSTSGRKQVQPASLHLPGPCALPPGASTSAAGLAERKAGAGSPRARPPDRGPAQPAQGASGEPLLEEVIQKPRWPGGAP